MEAKMPRTVLITTAVVLTIAAVAAWASTSIRTGATSKTLGPATEAQIDATGLTKTSPNLPVQQFDAF